MVSQKEVVEFELENLKLSPDPEPILTDLIHAVCINIYYFILFIILLFFLKHIYIRKPVQLIITAIIEGSDVNFAAYKYNRKVWLRTPTQQQLWKIYVANFG